MSQAMKENPKKKPSIALAVALIAAVALTGCEKPRPVNRMVELHYINGEVETKVLRGSTNIPPRIKGGYTPYYYDGNSVYGVVRFRILQADTLKGGNL